MGQSNNPQRHAILGHPPDPASQRMYPQSNYGNGGNQQMMYPNSNNYSGGTNYQLSQRGSNRDSHQMHSGMPSNKNNGNPPYGYNSQPPNQMRQQYGSNFYGQPDMYYNGVVNANSRYGPMDAQYPPMNSGYGPNYMDQNGKLVHTDCFLREHCSSSPF